MASVVSICNRALTQLGANLITSLDDNSTEAKVMDAAFNDALDAMLREARPLCATFRAALAQSSTSPVYGWDYAYQLPTEPYCLAVMEIDESVDSTKWTIEGRQLLTDESTVKIKYIGRITDTSKLDSVFVTALAMRLAAETCYALTQNASKEDRMWIKAEEALDKAMTADGAEKGSVIVEATLFSEARE